MIVGVSLVHPGDQGGADHGSLPRFSITRENYTAYCTENKDQNSKFQVRFLLNAFHFHTTAKWNHPKSGPVSTYLLVNNEFLASRPWEYK